MSKSGDNPNKPHCENCGKRMTVKDMREGNRDYLCVECSRKVPKKIRKISK